MKRRTLLRRLLAAGTAIICAPLMALSPKPKTLIVDWRDGGEMLVKFPSIKPGYYRKSIFITLDPDGTIDAWEAVDEVRWRKIDV